MIEKRPRTDRKLVDDFVHSTTTAGPHRADEPAGKEERADAGDVRRHGRRDRRRRAKPALRCLLIAGSPTVFCAGNDIGDFLKMATAGGALGTPILRFLYALARCELPLIAAVQGNAVGVGTTMLMHCDHVVAGSDARFSTPFVGLGLVPEAASSLIAPRLMGQARAFSLLVMGRPLSADEAKAAGLVNTVVAPDAVEAEAMKAAREIAALPPQGVLTSRRLMRGDARRDRRAHRRGSRTVQDPAEIARGDGGVPGLHDAQALNTAKRKRTEPCR